MIRLHRVQPQHGRGSSPSAPHVGRNLSGRRRTGFVARLFAVAAVLFGALLIVPVPSASAQEKSLVWERFDVDIVIQRDGTFDVAEHQTILFTRGAFTFGFREIAKDKLSSLSDWSLTDDSGNRYTLVKGSREPYSFTVTDQGSNYVIYWYFPPTANRSETYTLSYTVHGGLRYYEGGDQLWWQAIYDDRSFPVRAGRVNVTAPAAIQEWAAYINRGNEVWEDARADADASLLENKRARSRSRSTTAWRPAEHSKCGWSLRPMWWPESGRPGSPGPMPKRPNGRRPRKCARVGRRSSH